MNTQSVSSWTSLVTISYWLSSLLPLSSAWGWQHGSVFWRDTWFKGECVSCKWRCSGCAQWMGRVVKSTPLAGKTGSSFAWSVAEFFIFSVSSWSARQKHWGDLYCKELGVHSCLVTVLSILKVILGQMPHKAHPLDSGVCSPLGCSTYACSYMTRIECQ